MAVVTEQARAKINLTLHVRGRRADGYHLLESVVAFADFGDELSFERAADFTLDLTGPFADGLPEDDDNIVLDAARNLAHGVSDLPPGAAITLDKRLPVASGIGGGSADAAACIRGLLQLYGVDAAPNALHQIAVGLGADVPVCLRSEVSFMAGIGQLVTPLPRLPDVHCVLVNPRVPVPTAPIFQALGLSEGDPVSRFAAALARPGRPA